MNEGQRIGLCVFFYALCSWGPQMPLQQALFCLQSSLTLQSSKRHPKCPHSGMGSLGPFPWLPPLRGNGPGFSPSDGLGPTVWEPSASEHSPEAMMAQLLSPPQGPC